MAANLYDEWIKAKSKVAHSDAAFGALPRNVIVPGDRLYSLRLDSCGAYGSAGDSITKTLCTRCGRIGGKNARDFGIKVIPIDRINDECDDCGVSLKELKELNTERIITIQQIKKQMSRVESGNCTDDTDYNNLRRLQKAFAKNVAKDNMRITLKSSQVRCLNVKDFPEGCLISVRKYRVSCHGRRSKVYNVRTFVDISRGDLPNYLQDFIGGI